MKKFALITGASGGIGSAIALKLAKEGYSLYLHYHKNEAALKELLDQLQGYDGEFIPIQADLSSLKGYKTIVENVFSIDAIIHNSGMSHYGLLLDLEEQALENIMRVHVQTPILLTRDLLPKMLNNQKGNIVFISSIWGQTGGACESVYSAAKGAQISFVKALSKELAMNGIRVNAVAPGIIQTSMIEDFSQEDLNLIREEIPMGKLGVSNHVADAVQFLLSGQSSYITGQVLAVNGGWYT